MLYEYEHALCLVSIEGFQRCGLVSLVYVACA